MKELKIKIWDKDKQNMVKPQGITFDPKNLGPYAVKISGDSWKEVEQFELIQWTGLYDNNGENIYEGDLIKISSVIYEVAWNKTAARFELMESGKFLRRNVSDAMLGEIVGNKFENADLIIKQF